MAEFYIYLTLIKVALCCQEVKCLPVFVWWNSPRIRRGPTGWSSTTIYVIIGLLQPRNHHRNAFNTEVIDVIRKRIVEYPLQWRHNDHDGVSNHQPHGCLLKRLYMRWSKKTSKLRVTALCEGNSPGSVNSPHKGPVTRKMFPFDDDIMHILHNDQSRE